MNIKNYDKVLEELTAILKQFEKDLNEYQTDVYLYYNEETEEATLDTFVNVGGNSWINDDHKTIYSDYEHYNSFFDDWSTEDIASIIGIKEKEFIKEVAEFVNYEEDEIDNWAISKFLESHSEYYDKLYEYYSDEIDTDFNGIFADRAVEILDNFIEESEAI